MFHKEGYKIILTTFALTIVFFFLANTITIHWLRTATLIAILLFLVLILQFFRNPKRYTVLNDAQVLAPVDGKIVIIKEVFEREFFNEKRLQISIFMSPTNVHVTRYPISGNIVFSKYHPGKYLVAWHPKSSEKNERTTVVINNERFGNVLYRQIAGAVARRIVNYARVNEEAIQGDDSGFIKFGSRVDLFLPLNSSLRVTLNQKVRGGESIIAEMK